MNRILDSLMLEFQRPLVRVFNKLYYAMDKVLYKMGRDSNSRGINPRAATAIGSVAVP